MRFWDVETRKHIEVGLEEVTDLWCSCFPEDSREEFGSFQAVRLANASGYGVFRGNRLVSMAFFIPSFSKDCTATIDKNYKVGFIAGVATQKKERGHYFASRIIKSIAARAHAQGTDFLQLSTYIPNFYTKLGFKVVGKHYLWYEAASGGRPGLYQLTSASGGYSDNLRKIVICPYSEADFEAVTEFYSENLGLGRLYRSCEYWRWRLRGSSRVLLAYAVPLNAFSAQGAGEQPCLEDGKIRNGAGRLLAYFIGSGTFHFEEVLGADRQILAAAADFCGRGCTFSLSDKQLIKALRDYDDVGETDTSQMIMPLGRNFSLNEDGFVGLDDW